MFVTAGNDRKVKVWSVSAGENVMRSYSARKKNTKSLSEDPTLSNKLDRKYLKFC